LTKEFIQTDKAPRPGAAYSQGIRSGQILFVAGQGPVDPRTGKRAADIETQTRQTILNVKAILEAGGCSLEDVVKVTVYLGNADDFQKMNRVYQEFFSRNPPTRTTVVAKFVNSEMLVEIDAIAYRD
jgi:2-iminobutanoate/2-iminopropanoate deaminase